MTRPQRQFLTFILCQFLTIPLGLVVALITGKLATGMAVIPLAEVTVVLGWLLWIAVFDSRRKWPNVGWFTRLSYVLTFTR